MGRLPAKITGRLAPPIPAPCWEGFGDPIFSTRATENLSEAVLRRCVLQVMARRTSIPINDSWEEPAVTDIDGQSVIMVLGVAQDPTGRRRLMVKRARYQPKEGRRRN